MYGRGVELEPATLLQVRPPDDALRNLSPQLLKPVTEGMQAVIKTLTLLKSHTIHFNLETSQKEMPAYGAQASPSSHLPRHVENQALKFYSTFVSFPPSKYIICSLPTTSTSTFNHLISTTSTHLAKLHQKWPPLSRPSPCFS